MSISLAGLAGILVVAGLAGAALGWFLAMAREQRKLIDAESRRAAAEATANETRRQLDAERALIETAEGKLGNAFRALAAEALAANNQGFLTLAEQKLAAARRESDVALEARQKAIDALMTPVRESLDKVDDRIRDIERRRGEDYGRISDAVAQGAEANRLLGSETRKLAQALRAPAVRGRWGEVQLRRVVELAGMIEHCDFSEQETIVGEGGRRRPDLVVHLPGGRSAVVDAKVPLEAYLDAIEADGDDERRERLAVHAQQVRAHIVKLAGKSYWADLPDTPEFVFMFLPLESAYAAALEAMPSLIEEGPLRRVLIATPTTLIALLQTVHLGWREERLADSAREISDRGRELHERLATMLDHWGKVGGAIERAARSFNDSVGSLESRVLPAARRLEELGAGGPKPVPELPRVDVRTRLVRAAAGDGTDDAAPADSSFAAPPGV